MKFQSKHHPVPLNKSVKKIIDSIFKDNNLSPSYMPLAEIIETKKDDLIKSYLLRFRYTPLLHEKSKIAKLILLSIPFEKFPSYAVTRELPYAVTRELQKAIDELKDTFCSFSKAKKI